MRTACYSFLDYLGATRAELHFVLNSPRCITLRTSPSVYVGSLSNQAYPQVNLRRYSVTFTGPDLFDCLCLPFGAGERMNFGRLSQLQLFKRYRAISCVDCIF